MKTSHIVVLVVLPYRYNPSAGGRRRRVESRKFQESMQEISVQFGGGVLWQFGSNPPHGFWWQEGVLHEDETTILEVDIPNNKTAKAWLIDYARTVLLKRFRQQAIYLRFVRRPIQVEVVRIQLD